MKKFNKITLSTALLISSLTPFYGEIVSAETETFNKVLSINPNITFIIGGSYGLSTDIKKLSHFKLSFSDLTFPHQLFRIMLLEQIYRSFKILNNESYHK